ncbi:uncharacterized protein FMAN_15244 [Fusarium mangiferae]|uniref:Uncharacterized protein n=1 Tax=Fusarium mangiferae TaxID=192010 RepID=A0A1L7U6K8_FUSMA|nr:uncharacterized protein FMAN_15244 [Fusarium mangiferae]CVL03347.1 uncharacterized protein FMAN_15244 [Fusarium mangiferae]
MDERVPNDPPWEADYPGSPGLPHPPASEIALLPGVTTFLQQTEPYERVAKEFRASWESVQHDDKHDVIAKAFYEAGDFVAWFAYFRIKRAAEQSASCTGKTDCRRLIDILQHADVHIQRQLATKVVAVFSDEQKEKIEKLHEKMSPPAARQRQSSTHDQLQISEAPQPHTTPSFNTDRVMIERPTIPAPNSFLTSYEQVIVNPPLNTAKKLLHKDLSNAIGTTQNPIPKGALLAAISMAFPPTGGKDDCQMVLEILEDKVQHFAKRWFKKRLESKDGLRCLVARDGSTIVPYPQFTLRGFQRRRRTDFGLVVSHAITTSPRYQDDEKHSRPYTDGVSMVVSAQANARAHVYLSLGLVEGIRIKDKLFV